MVTSSTPPDNNTLLLLLLLLLLLPLSSALLGSSAGVCPGADMRMLRCNAALNCATMDSGLNCARVAFNPPLPLPLLLASVAAGA
jgi:hypothetical protein